MLRKPIYAVSQVNDAIRDLLASDRRLQDVWICGEILNLKTYHYGKQIYFNLSDGVSQINCVIYETFMSNIEGAAQLENGLFIVARGKVKLFQKRGQISFQVVYCSVQKPGDQSLAFEQLKQKLLKEGLFDDENKKPLPSYPSEICLITANQSAAMADFVTIAHHHIPGIPITVIPAVMQGTQAQPTLIKALNQAVDHRFPIIVILRGGGGQEDLACFNDEKLVRAVANCPIPVVAAVGHETDYTLLDFVCDYRAPTPTAAANQICQPFIFLKQTLRELSNRVSTVISNQITDQKNEIQTASQSALTAISHRHQVLKNRLDHLVKRVELANPLHKFGQGFSICTLKKGAIIKSIKQIKPKADLETRLVDGIISSTVTNIHVN